MSAPRHIVDALESVLSIYFSNCRHKERAAFILCDELVVGHVAAGSRNERIRGYLKALAKETWALVNWLTHSANVTRIDGTMAIDATHSVKRLEQL
jgi:hypothetical protein